MYTHVNQTIEDILEEVDEDIKDKMMKVTTDNLGEELFAWQFLVNPALTILEWQKLRDRNK